MGKRERDQCHMGNWIPMLAGKEQAYLPKFHNQNWPELHHRYLIKMQPQHFKASSKRNLVSGKKFKEYFAHIYGAKKSTCFYLIDNNKHRVHFCRNQFLMIKQEQNILNVSWGILTHTLSHGLWSCENSCFLDVCFCVAVQLQIRRMYKQTIMSRFHVIKDF